MRGLAGVALGALVLAAAVAGGWAGAAPSAAYDPYAVARARTAVANPEAVVPPPCYTATAGESNPCWACHTIGRGRNRLVDADLQEEYAFSDTALSNRWTNLFVDRRYAQVAISDEQALAWIRGDNYGPLRAALAERAGSGGAFVADLDLDAGFDADGFARDGSGWRAYRYKPFLGAFFPTNGSTGDAFIRLPEAFRVDAAGAPSRAIYAENLEILARAIATPPEVDARLPATYAGGAAKIAVVRFDYPLGTELLHTVRYVDPDAPNLLSRRLKELRYMRKVRQLDEWANQRRYEQEGDAKDEGRLPVFAGTPETGLVNDFGWQLLGFIEDERGRLRAQTREETLFCMGCHSTLGVTVDQTFSFARRPPGAAGWGWQDLRGMVDAPQAGQGAPEIASYFARVGGGDELRANAELAARGEADVGRAAPGGDRDLHWLLAPSRARALALTKAYLAVVLEQSFTDGRDTVLQPAVRVHRRIENGSTELGAAGRTFTDGRLWLDWPASAVSDPPDSGEAKVAP